MASEEKIQQLIRELKAGYSIVRGSCAKALGKIGDVRAVPALIEALKHSDSDLRIPSAEALGMIGDVRAVPALLKALKDSDEFVRSGSALALGKIGDASLRPFLTVLLEAWNKNPKRLENVPAFCRKFTDDDSMSVDVRTGAQAVLQRWQDRKYSIRASDEPINEEEQ